MNLQTRVVRSESAMTSPIEDELVMFDTKAGKYYGFNQVASAIWEHLAREISVLELRDHLTARFDISPEACYKEIAAFLPQLEKKGLVKVLK